MKVMCINRSDITCAELEPPTSLGEDDLDTPLVNLVCNAYTGPKPSACKSAKKKVCLREPEKEVKMLVPEKNI